ncbi:glycerol-3-phosphate dehydrogenase/oxidase [Flavobacteriaceae bacterium]|nr:glycerol-3-phosphate dehydrogenase/oxidase [Flavobacteriaceae bacterium]MDA8923489.1 glycerol-3-phosphate dehydrogenase/oxidase [Flavobacteriaceae bacterium]MDA9244784.1 glycerol-3-phosphate dehydrogenase/oxidase [Flavobacteriaceae bacterium]MDA9984411.1 glycerol-3-phosphate dehydrogenase/oxidase [Flavobacteriaceae bacterium]MDB4112742.1 glycerol-3-phosphate dehydrogenase/oxidase [Flavobacteriaceae bacterium]
MKREEHLAKIDARKKPWDVLIIGGGASGLGAAVDAASRGYRTLLLEKYDFAKGTSSRSTKLVHGGVRYLQNGDVSLVIEALKERGIMRKNAPHLVQDLSFVIPSYDWWNSPFYGIGLKIYDMMAGNLGLGPSTLLDRQETIDLIPNVKKEGLRGGVIYHDGQFDDARMAISLAQTAENHGASLLNYFSVTGMNKENNMISGVQAKDELSGKTYSIEAKVVINATGVFSDEVIQMDQRDAKKRIVPSQGVHIVLDKRFLSGPHAIMVPHTSDGRVLFAVPWNGYVVVGTTDTQIKEALVEPIAQEEEIQFILDNAGMYMTTPPTRDDIKSVFSGLRPLAAPENDGSATKEISRHHKVIVSTSGLVSILGGKWTTYRKMAEDIINTAQSVGGLPERGCITHNLPVHGYDYNSDWTNPLHVYGVDIDKIIKLDLEGNTSLSKEVHLTKNQVIWAIREEMAMTVEDVLARRTRVLFLNASESLILAPTVAAIMGKEMGKDSSWIATQIENYTTLTQNYLMK